MNVKKQSEDKKKTNKKKSGIAFALWVLAALFLLILFIVNQNKIATNLKETGFFNKTGLKTPEFVENAEPSETVAESKNDVEPIGPVEIDLNAAGRKQQKTVETSPSPVTPKNETAKKQQKEAVEEKNSVPEKDDGRTSSVEKARTEKKETKETIVKKEVSVSTAETKQMKIKLYFMTINSNGTVARKEVTRQMKKSDSPLVDAIKAIISGPSDQEENSGCRTLISNGTRLIGASVKNGTATLNFSGEFEFNQYGIEGLRGQLQQIVYTATAFPTVENVQFLVDGEKKEYLGQEGVWIGTPLGRNSF